MKTEDEVPEEDDIPEEDIDEVKVDTDEDKLDTDIDKSSTVFSSIDVDRSIEEKRYKHIVVSDKDSDIEEVVAPKKVVAKPNTAATHDEYSDQFESEGEASPQKPSRADSETAPDKKHETKEAFKSTAPSGILHRISGALVWPCALIECAKRISNAQRVLSSLSKRIGGG